MRAFTRENPYAAGIIGLFIALAVTFSLITPAFETPDERHHFAMSEHISRTGRIPVQVVGDGSLWGQEANQAPLYYLVTGAMIAPIDTSDLLQVHQLNPHAKLGLVPDPDNKMVMLDTGVDQFPWHGTILALRLIRFFSIALGAVTITLVYLIGQETWADTQWPALLLMSLVAFNPQFLFISGAMNNDNLTNTLAAAVILILVRIAKRGLTDRRALTLAVVLAVTTLSKVSGITLIPLAGLVLAYQIWQTGTWKGVLKAGGMIVAAWLLFASWWYIRNLILYDELLGMQILADAVPCNRSLTVWDLRHEWYGFFVSYFALFGHVNIIGNGWFYWFMGAVYGVGLIGFAVYAVRQLIQKQWESLVIPAIFSVHVGVVFYGLIRWTMICWASQGRLTFSSIGSLAALVTIGLVTLIPQHYHRVTAIVVALPMLVFSAMSPHLYIAPVYEEPSIVEALPESAIPVGMNFDGLEIVAVEVDNRAYIEGTRVPVTLYIRVNKPNEDRLSISLTLLGRDLEEIGKLDTYPGGGNLLTTEMIPGMIYRDTYSIRLAEGIATPSAIRLLPAAGLFDPNAGQFTIYQPTSSTGEPIQTVFIETGAVYPADDTSCAIMTDDDVPIGGIGTLATLALRSASDNPVHPGEDVPLVLVWQQNVSNSSDWTVFLHMVGEDGAIVAQADGLPMNGDYPTRLWHQPCGFVETRTLRLPGDLLPGTYSLYMGMYNASDPAFTRLPVTLNDGTAPPDSAIPLTVIEVVAP